MSKAEVAVPNSTTVSAVIHRADGMVEEVGLVAAQYENPVRQFWFDHVIKRRTDRRIKRINRSHQSKELT